VRRALKKAREAEFQEEISEISQVNLDAS